MSNAAEKAHSKAERVVVVTDTEVIAPRTSRVRFRDHLKAGTEDLLVRHLHGVALSLTTFLEAREKGPRLQSRSWTQPFKLLNDAHRKYRAETCHVQNEFVDHLLAYPTATGSRVSEER